MLINLIISDKEKNVFEKSGCACLDHSIFVFNNLFSYDSCFVETVSHQFGFRSKIIMFVPSNY